MRTRLLGIFAVCFAVVIAAGFPSAAQADPGDIGFQDQSYAGASGGISGEKPESKLWWNDGFWWASLFDGPSGDYHIFRLEPSTQTWVDTNIRLDDRPSSRADVLWDGAHLYVASHVFGTGATSAAQSRLYRYSYATGTDTYSLDAGFPVNINNVKSETLAIEKDSTGQLWATWTQGSPRQVYVNRTTGSDTSWGTPFVLPGSGTTVSADDISSVVSFGGNKIGVMWSNQSGSAMYFSVHNDADQDTIWQGSRTAIQGPGQADDHINLKSLQAADGRVFAAVKTSLSGANSPLVLLLVRDPATGDWSNHVFGRKSDGHTRPIVMIDSEHGVLHMFATAGEGGGTIYEKTSPLNSISFPTGRGTPVIRDADVANMNNATSTKQNVNSTTGLVVLATNATTQRYWHHFDSLGGSPPPPPTNTAPTALSGAASTTAGTPVAISLGGRDAEQCELSFAIGSGPTHGTLGSIGSASCTMGSPNADTAPVTYTPDAGYEGPDSFSFTVSDGSLTSAEATVSITVNPAPGPGGGISFVSQSSASNATATSLTISAPSGVSAGNLLIASVAVRGNPTITAPTGWTLVRLDLSVNVIRQAIYRKLATSPEAPSYTWTFSSAQAAAGGIMEFSGVDAASPIDAHMGQANAASKSIVAPSITTTTPNTMLIGLFAIGPATTVTPPVGMTERWEAVSTAGTYKATAEAATVVQAAAGATGTRTATAGASGANVGQLVALRPA